jgi:two-component system chemotaxis response regulator CheB
MGKIRVLVVDDSMFFRTTLRKILSLPDIQLIATASNGKDAIKKIQEYNPDIITMDIEMPVLDGIGTIKWIMSNKPTPVIVLSSSSDESARKTIKSLNLGAIDFVSKDNTLNSSSDMKKDLISKIRIIANDEDLQRKFAFKRNTLSSKFAIKKSNAVNSDDIRKKLINKAKSARPLSASGVIRPDKNKIEIIGIGISTGGPEALSKFFGMLSDEIPVPIVISQHMPAHFTKSLANRLNTISGLTIKEAENYQRIKPGHVYIAPGGMHLRISKTHKINISEEPASSVYKPSVDIMMKSIAEIYENKAIGLIMTGMGNDGLEGLKLLKEKGSYILSQESSTCVVSGMTRAVINAGIADEIIPLDNLAKEINSIFELVN